MINPRVYYVNSGLQGCYFVRCLLPLMANGWDGDQTSISLDSKLPEDKAISAQKADVVVFHRPEDEGKLKLARLLKKLGKKIVFDNDDTFKDNGGYRFNEYMDEKRFEKGMKSVNETIDLFIKEADLVTCSTDFLLEEYKKLNDNVIVLPNCVDPFYFDEPLKNEDGKVRIGIVGSLAVTADLEKCKPIIEHFKDREDVTIVLYSLPNNGVDKITRELYSEEYKWLDTLSTYKNIEWQPFTDFEVYYDILNQLRLDIAIIPRDDNYFNRCKSNLKFLEMSMLEIPVIAQGFEDGQSPYERDEEDAKHMIIVKDDKNWIPEIESLIKDSERRVTMGKSAREYVISKYDIEKNANKWVEAYKSLYK